MENKFDINEYETLPKEPLFKPEPPKSEVPSQGVTNLVGDMQRASAELLPSERIKLGSLSGGFGRDQRISLIRKGPDRGAYTKLSDGTLKPRLEQYNAGLTTQQNEEILAQHQTASEKWSNGALKFLGKTGVNVAGGIVGTVNGLIQGIRYQSLSAVYDNDVSRTLEDWNKSMDADMANYRTAAERDMNFGQKMGTANFWADDFLGGLSFLAGTIISEGAWAAATGGGSLIAKGAVGLAGRAALKASKGAALKTLKATATKEGKTLLNKSAKNTVENLASAGIAANKLQKGLNSVRFLYTSAGYEASVEARGYLEEAKEAFINETLTNEGRIPTPEEMGAFTDDATSAANGVFAANTALVGFSNTVVLGKLLLGKGTTRKLSNSFFNKNVLGIGFKKEGAKLVALNPTKFQKNLSKAFSVGKPVFTEGVIEEGGQGVLSTTAMDYVMSGYDQDSTNDNLSIYDAFTQGIHEQYTSKEGLTEVGLGALIGLFGGGISTKGRFNEYAQVREGIENNVKYQNQFTTDMLVNNMITANKVAVANKQGEAARAQGNLTGEMTADTSSMVATIERGLMYQSTNEMVEDLSVALDTYSNEKLSEMLGMTEQEALTWKSEKLQEYKGLAETHGRNMEFAEAILGDRNIAGLKNIEGLDARGQADLQSAIAYSLTMGKRSDEFSEAIASQIKQLVASDLSTGEEVDAINVNSVLSKVEETQKARYYSTLNRMRALQKEANNLETELINAQNLPEVEGQTGAKATKIANVTKRLATTQAAIEKASQAKTLAFSAMNIQQLTEEIITEDMLDNQQENIQKLKENINNLSMRTPQQGPVIAKLMEEYDRAVEQTRTYNQVVKTLVSPKTRVSTLNGWANSIINRKKEVEGDTAAMFVKATKTYVDDMARNKMKTFEEVNDEIEKAKQKTEVQEVEDNEDVTEKNPLDQEPAATTEMINAAAALQAEVQSETETKGKSAIDVLNERINEAISKNPYLNTKYAGQANVNIEEVKPTQKDIDRYNELLGKIPPNKNKQEVLRVPFGSIVSNLTEEETTELQAINRKLNNWQILSGFNDNGSSVAEVLQVIAQLEETFVPNNTQSEVQAKDFFNPESGVEAKNSTKRTPVNTVISPAEVVAKKTKGNYEISHLKIQSLGKLFPGAEVFIKDGGKAITLATIPDAKLAEYNQTPGTEVVVNFNGTPINFKTDERQRLVVSAKELNPAIATSNFRVLDFGVSKFLPIFVKNQDGQWAPLDGDFKIESTVPNETISLVSEDMYRMAPGTPLRTIVNLNDTFNAQLLKDYRNGIIKEEEFINNLSIYLTEQGATNKTIGVLRAIKSNTNVNSVDFSKLYMIRKIAAKKALSSPGSKVEVGISVGFSTVFIGSPNVVVQENADGSLTTQNIDFTEDSIKLIEDFGYIQDGVVKTNKGIDYNSSEIVYAAKTSKKEKNKGQKVPVVVFNYKGRRTVFPVSLITSQAQKQNALDSIVNSNTKSDAAKVFEINQLLLDNNIDPSLFNITDLESDQSAFEISRAREALMTKPTFANVESWLEEGFPKRNLLDQARIAIDITDKPFGAPKGFLDMKGVSMPNEEDMRFAQVSVLDNYAKKVDNIFRETNPFAEMTVNTKFYDAFEEDGIAMDADSYVMKKRNANILTNAFNQSIPKSVREVLGETLIKNIRTEIKQLEIIEKGLKTNKEILNGSLKNEIESEQTKCK